MRTLTGSALAHLHSGPYGRAEENKRTDTHAIQRIAFTDLFAIICAYIVLKVIYSDITVLCYDIMSFEMSSTNPTLADRKNDLTRSLILDAAIEVLAQAPVSELTIRAAARHANISERTVFRYFTSRDEFLDAVALELGARLELPWIPATLDDLRTAARTLYPAFEAKHELMKASLHSELYPRMRVLSARQRWNAVRDIINPAAAFRTEQERKIAIANVRYFLSATTWYYYRSVLGMDIEESVTCAETVIGLTLDSIR